MNLAIVHSEVTKIRTLRSCLVALAAFCGLSLGLGALSGWSVRRAIDQGSPMISPEFDPEAAGLAVIGYTQFALLVFGVLVVGHEYSSGMIQLSLTAVPRRGALYAAKLLAGAGIALLAAIPAVVLGYLATQAGLGPYGAALGAADLPRAMCGAVGYLVLTTLFATGVAAIVRSPVGALAILAPMYFFISQLLATIQATAWFAKYLPDQAGFRMFAVGTDLTRGAGDAAPLSPALGSVVLLAWTCVAAVIGFVRVRRLEP